MKYSSETGATDLMNSYLTAFVMKNQITR